MNRLQNKVAIITGSSYGIGFEIAKRLGLEGAKVVICSRNQKHVESAEEKLRQLNVNVFGIKCDVGNKAERLSLFEQTLRKYGQLDILVSNVATNPAVKMVFDTDEGEWDHIFNINVKSSFMLAKEALPYLRKQAPGSSIVFISSVVGVNPVPFIGAYSVSKTALLALTKVASSQLADDGIRVNCVAPGPIETSFLDGLQKKLNLDLSIVPMRRCGKPEEISGIVAFLVSKDASFITGETVVAAGASDDELLIPLSVKKTPNNIPSVKGSINRPTIVKKSPQKANPGPSTTTSNDSASKPIPGRATRSRK